MTDLEEYVEQLFRRQRPTPEVKDLKEEILSNMCAKRDDFILHGLDAASAAEKAKESLSDIDCLIDGTQLTDIGRYRLECSQTVLLNCVIFWILSFPLLFTCYAVFSYMGLALVIISGCVYLFRKSHNTDSAAFLSVTASVRRRTIAWSVWGIFFFIAAGTMLALTFGSDVWFGRPFHVSGPYQMANIMVRIYLPLLTIIVPITLGSFSKILLKCRKGQENG